MLETLWQSPSATAQTVLEQLSDSNISLSTVQSTLERLHRKELVDRQKSGRAYIYSARLSRQNIISRLLRDIADSFSNGDTAPMVSGFLDYLADEDAQLSSSLKDRKRGTGQ